MRRAAVIAFVIAVLAIQACSAPSYSPRICAEWEPAVGTMIAWPLKIPRELVELLASEEILFVLVAYDDQEIRARRIFDEWGLDGDRIRFIRTSVETEWTRDYGAHQVFDASGTMLVVDPIYIDTPVFGVRGQTVNPGDEIRYFGRWPGDDRSNVDVAAALGLGRRFMPAYLTGGNFLVDGHGTAFMTRAMVDENNSRMSDEAFLQMVEEFTGVHTCHVLDNTESPGIQHIDCWLKVLDEERLLVKQAPPDHPEYDWIEGNVRKLRQLETCFGRPYEILRIDCPVFGMERGFNPEEEPALPAYTNSLILNHRVFVPLFGGPGDEAALATYREVLPGYEVHGIQYEGWRSFDALHCRTRAVFDRHMLRLVHPRVRGEQPPGKPIPVTVSIQAMSGARLIRGELQLRWRTTNRDEWASTGLERTEKTGTYVAEIPAQKPESTVEYFFTAADGSGRRSMLPPSAPEGFYSLIFGRGQQHDQ